MSRYFTIYINSGTSPGPYNVYYNTIGSGNIATVYPTGLPATNLTLSQLLVGVTVYAPVDIVDLYLYNELCETSKNFNIPQVPVSYPDICITVQNREQSINDQYSFSYNYNTVNGKPEYETFDGYLLNWNTNGYWEFITYPGSVRLQSNDADNVPDSNWSALGPGGSLYIITAQQGVCFALKNPNNLNITYIDPTCYGNTDGSISAIATGGAGGWVYSLNGIMYNNSVGIFTSLGGGQYTVYAKDLSGDVISQTVTLTAQPVNNFTITGVRSVTNLPTVGNMNYYLVTINYDTSQIPTGGVVFDYEMVYNLSYTGPGSAIFDTTQHYLTINGNPLVINSAFTNTLTATTLSSCNPIYSQYDGSNGYVSTGISLLNGDVFTANIIYGIDTKTNGIFDGVCYTKSSVILNLILGNVKLYCDCCNINNTIINISEPIQIYQP